MLERTGPEEYAGDALRRAQGFSMIELLVVLAIIVIMVAVTLPSLVTMQRAYATDDAAGQTLDFLRAAYEQSLTQRQVMRVRIDRAAGTIQIIDEETAGNATDDKVIRSEALTPQSTVAIGKPTGQPDPPPPYNFTAAAFSSNVWEIRFRSDGVAINATHRPQSAALYFYTPRAGNPTATDDTGLVRVVTIFGPTGSVKLWGYTGSAYVQR